MFQIFAIRRLTAFVTRVAKANGSTSNLVPNILLGILASLLLIIAAAVAQSSNIGSSYGSWRFYSSQSVAAGRWIPAQPDSPDGFCALTSPMRVVASGASFGSDEYRVMVLPELFGAPVEAEVWWEWSD